MATFVLVHGGFCRGWVWTTTAEALREAGHRVVVLDLPSCGTSAAGLGDLSADVGTVRDAVDDADDGVVLVGHSSGGMALAALADHPEVRHSVLVAALSPQEGQSVADLLGGSVPDWMVLRDDGAVQVSDDAELVRRSLCADVDETRFVRDVHPRYVLSSWSSLTAPSAAPARTHPATYVVCEHDQAVPVDAQQAFAARCDRVERLPSSHSPMLAVPGRLADLLARVAAPA